MFRELPLKEIGAAHYTAAGKRLLYAEWCEERPVCAVCGPGAVSLLQSPVSLCEDTVVCRFKHCCSPFETVGWVFEKACVLHAFAPISTAVHTIHTLEFLPCSFAEETARAEACYRQAVAFLQSAAGLFRHTLQRALSYIDEARMERYAARLAARERGPKGRGAFHCFFSYLSSKTYHTDYAAITAICPRIYVIEDTALPVGHCLTEALARCFSALGQTVIIGICPLTGCAEHLLLPDSGVAFTLSNHWHTVDFPVYQRIYTARFFKSAPSLHKSNLFYHGTDELLQECMRSLREAERYYTLCEAEAFRVLDKEAVMNAVRQKI